MERTAILSKTPEEIKAILDCNEGLQTAFLRETAQSENFISALTSARYTTARIRRIALHCLLNIRENFIRECLQSPLYLQPLAYKKNGELLKALSEASIPFLDSGKAVKALTATAREAFEKEEFADKIYRAVKNLSSVPTSPTVL